MNEEQEYVSFVTDNCAVSYFIFTWKELVALKHLAAAQIEGRVVIDANSKDVHSITESVQGQASESLDEKRLF